MKNSNNRSEIEPATFRLLAQCLNQLRHQQRAPSLLVILAKYYSSGQIEEDGMGRAFGTYGEEDRIIYRICSLNRKEKDRLEDVGVDGKVIKRIITNQEWIKQPGLTWLRVRKVTGSSWLQALRDFRLCVTSGFHHEVAENCTLLRYYTTSGDNYFPAVSGQPIGPIFRGHEGPSTRKVYPEA